MIGIAYAPRFGNRQLKSIGQWSGKGLGHQGRRSPPTSSNCWDRRRFLSWNPQSSIEAILALTAAEIGSSDLIEWAWNKDLADSIWVRRLRLFKIKLGDAIPYCKKLSATG